MRLAGRETLESFGMSGWRFSLHGGKSEVGGWGLGRRGFHDHAYLAARTSSDANSSPNFDALSNSPGANRHRRSGMPSQLAHSMG